MRVLIACALALGALAPPAVAQVESGSVWTWPDGTTLTVNVTQDLFGGTSVTYTDANGTTSPVAGTAGPNSSVANPNVKEAPGATTPGNPGNTFKVTDPAGPQGSAAYKKNADGTWSRGKRKKKSSGAENGMEWLRAGDTAPAPGTLRSPLGFVVVLNQGDIAPVDGYFCPSDEVVSLPMGTGFHTGSAP